MGKVMEEFEKCKARSLLGLEKRIKGCVALKADPVLGGILREMFKAVLHNGYGVAMLFDQKEDEV